MLIVSTIVGRSTPPNPFYFPSVSLKEDVLSLVIAHFVKRRPVDNSNFLNKALEDSAQGEDSVQDWGVLRDRECSGMGSTQGQDSAKGIGMVRDKECSGTGSAQV